MRISLFLLILFSSLVVISAQDLEISGKVNIGTMIEDNEADSVVVRQSDGTLGLRGVSTLGELQILSISNDTIYLTGGGYVRLPMDKVADGDSSSTNELQTISRSGLNVSLSDGGSYQDSVLTESDVDSFVAGDILDSMNVVRQELADSTAMINNKTLALMDSISTHRSDLTTLFASDTSATNELQSISLMSDSLTLSDGGGKVRIDTSNTNEKITSLSITGDSLSITEGGMTMKVAVDSSNTNELQTLSQVLSQDSSANQRIKNVIDPIDAQDAATKAYVDAAISAALSSGSSTMAVEDFGIKYATKSGIRGLIGEGYDIGDLIGLGVDTVELVAYGLIDSLIYRGARLQDIRGAGVSVQQLLTAGVRPQSIYNIGVSIDSLYGKTYAGGLIFYLNTTYGMGLVAAPYGWYSGGADPLVQWGCDNTTNSGADGAAIGTGKQNTLDIVNGCIERSAASVCSDYYDGTYRDWFLPSKDELNEMYLKLKVKGLGGFNDDEDSYWSSTEVDGYDGVSNAWYQRFPDGNPNNATKDNRASVRACRAFF